MATRQGEVTSWGRDGVLGRGAGVVVGCQARGQGGRKEKG
jgi:hypothetical protein